MGVLSSWRWEETGGGWRREVVSLVGVGAPVALLSDCTWKKTVV